ncbi:MAG TPA: hypothetical protein VEP49_17595 [Acidimicrobiia bacterium]|nr:hypothetical protein [Acidimicrobiia bacterium]
MTVGVLYLERLGRDDLRALAEVARRAGDRAATPEHLSSDPDRLVALLADARAYAQVFGSPDNPAGLATPASPFLTFAVALHRAAAELAQRTYTAEWVGPNRRLPVFDVDVLRDFVSDPMRRLFLVELLASYTHVASGATWERTPRGWRRRRFSELDPSQLASLLDVVPESDRPGVYRRLGDLALFLTGVFPDHTANRLLSPVQRDRLVRVSGADRLAGADFDTGLGAVAFLEALGGRWYRLAATSARPPLTATMQVAASVAERFRAARRILNDVTDRYLLPRRGQLFGLN